MAKPHDADVGSLLGGSMAHLSETMVMYAPTQPPARFGGDVYTAPGLAHVPSTLREATELFAGCEFVREVLGSHVQAPCAHCFRVADDADDRAGTDWKRRRHFERI